MSAVERYILANGLMEPYNSLDVAHTYQHPDGVKYTLATDYDALSAQLLACREALKDVLTEARTCGDSTMAMDAGIDAIIDIAAAALKEAP